MNKFIKVKLVKGLLAALGGAGCAVLAPIASGKIFGVDYNFKTLCAAAIGGAVGTVVGYFTPSPNNPPDSDPQTISPQAMKKFLLSILLILLPYFYLTPPASASKFNPSDANSPSHPLVD